MSARNYWIGVVSKSHVDVGVAGGFTQINHGKAGPLERMRQGDGFAYYSPRTEHPYGTPVQAFTAIGRVRAGAIFQAESDGSRPFRRSVEYLPAHEAPVRPHARVAVVHPQQAALGRGVSLRFPARAGGGLRAHRRRDGARFRSRFRGRAADST